MLVCDPWQIVGYVESQIGAATTLNAKMHRLSAFAGLFLPSDHTQLVILTVHDNNGIGAIAYLMEVNSEMLHFLSGQTQT